MARKGQQSIQDSVETEEEFENYLKEHLDLLVCIEVYSDFCGHCIATGQAIRKIKLEVGQDKVAVVKAMADNIPALVRFKNKSEPVFLFVYKGKLTRAMFGANGIELIRIAEEELKLVDESKVTGALRTAIEINEMLPEEADKIEAEIKLNEAIMEEHNRIRTLTQAARKKRVCERLAPELQNMNFILFWPGCFQAHVELYEKWDLYQISVAAKDEFLLDEEGVKEALYMSDVDPNDACVHALTSANCLVVVFKIDADDKRDIVKIMRHAVYEELPKVNEDAPPEKQLPPLPAAERYATISKSKQQVRRDRYNIKLAEKAAIKADQERLEKEQARIAREAEEEKAAAEKQRQEEERFARIQAGLPADPEPEPVPEGEEVEESVQAEEVAVEEVELEQEKVEEEEVFHSDVSVEDEDYIPQGGLYVPGLYCPANELAKANGLAYFFPKLVEKVAKIESEFLPPHLLMMFPVEKRQDVKEVIGHFKDEIINMGVFYMDDDCTDPLDLKHLAFSFKQYETMTRIRRHRDRLVLMVSRKRSLPTLQLAGLNPCYISNDVDAGEKECLKLFPVGYGDEFFEEESVVEEEVVEEPPEAPGGESGAASGPE